MPKKLTQEEFIAKSRAKYGDIYGYEYANYERSDLPIELVCPNGHRFTTRPDRHLQGHGCPICKAINTSKRTKGKIRVNNRKKLIYGVGVNDYQGVTKTDDKAYHIWRQILARCYDARTQQKSPSYVGCSICEEWKRFSVFKEWFDKNYIQGYCLDKDLTKRGNKVYCPEYCTFIPNEINVLVNTHKRGRGKTKSVGVSLFKGKFNAQCSFGDGNPKFLGAFDTERDAFIAYKQAKESYIKRIANEYYSKGKINKNVYETLMNWTVHPYD